MLSQILQFNVGDLHSLKFFQYALRQPMGGFGVSFAVSLPEVPTLDRRSIAWQD
jgi:hypothetical protein